MQPQGLIDEREVGPRVADLEHVERVTESRQGLVAARIGERVQSNQQPMICWLSPAWAILNCTAKHRRFESPGGVCMYRR